MTFGKNISPFKYSELFWQKFSPNQGDHAGMPTMAVGALDQLGSTNSDARFSLFELIPLLVLL